MEQHAEPQHETFNPWSIVNLVFHHLADQGLHPILGQSTTAFTPWPFISKIPQLRKRYRIVPPVREIYRL